MTAGLDEKLMPTTDPKARAQAFKAKLEVKIQALVTDFADGKLSREQFHTIYDRYIAQLSIVSYALASDNAEAFIIADSGISTLMVKDAFMGKALGMVIYHNKSVAIVETLGKFDVPVTAVVPTLSRMAQAAKSGGWLDRRVQELADKRWLVFTLRKHTIVVTLFQNEPSQIQMQHIERMQNDFEAANHVKLAEDTVQKSALAFSFQTFIKQQIDVED